MTTLATRPLALDDSGLDLLFREARTANAFGPEDVTDAQLQAIVELSQLGPTAMNNQPLRVLAVRSPEARERLVAHLADGNKAKTSAAPLTVVLGYDLDFHEQLPTVFPIFPGAKDLFADEATRHVAGRDNAWLQAGFFLVAARAAGLAAGPMGGFDAAGVDAEFFADGRTRSVLVVNLGTPVEPQFARLPRLSYDQVVTEV